MIGGASGGLYAGLTHTHRFATGSSGLPAVLLYIGDDTMRFFYNIIIALIITMVVTAAATFILMNYFEKNNTAAKETADATGVSSIEMKSGTIYAPVSGIMGAQKDIPDETFSSGVLGKGISIKPENGTITAPFSGTISSIAPSKHAVGITSPDGMEVLIHVGIDTVCMNGLGFDVLVKEDESVTIGQTLLKFDRSKIASAGYPDDVVVLLTNSDDFENLKVESSGPVTAGRSSIMYLG